MSDVWLCSSCDHFDFDEYWDGEEEVYIYVCKKGHANHIGWNTEPCEDFALTDE